MNSTAPLLLIRADAGPAIGSGHAMRSLALAEAWTCSGGKAALLTFRPSEALLARASAAGAAVIDVHAAHPDPSDLGTLIDSIRNSDGQPWVAIDGYGFDADYLAAVLRAGARTLRIDDGPAGDVPCDILIDQNAGAEDGNPGVPPAALRLLGPRWALLRPHFSQVGANRQVRKAASRILVSFGGTDIGGATSLALRVLMSLAPGYEAVVVLGPESASRNEVAALAQGLPVRIQHGGDMPALMAWADLAILGGGVTMLEACASALPSIVLVLAENQARGTAALAALQAVRSLGHRAAVDEAQLAEAVRELQGAFQVRSALAERARRAVDGGGLERVVATMRALAVERLDASCLRVRPAEEFDSREVWRVANDPAVRANSFDPKPIPWIAHERWFRERLADSEEAFFVADVGCVAGHFRLTPLPEGAVEVHFYVHPSFRGKGLGTLLLKAAAAEAARRGKAGTVEGVAFPGNQASRKAFLSAGFSSSGETIRNGRAVVVFRREVLGASGAGDGAFQETGNA